MMKLRRIRLVEHVAHMGEMRSTDKVLVRKSEGKRPLRRPELKWIDNIIMDLREIEWEDMGWMNLDEDRDQWQALLDTVINLRLHKRQGSSWLAE
jgi:hypothetical protein